MIRAPKGSTCPKCKATDACIVLQGGRLQCLARATWPKGVKRPHGNSRTVIRCEHVWDPKQQRQGDNGAGAQELPC